jgi:phosphatidylglycerophosphatase C
MKTLALFDFDGTLFQKDSLIEFTKFYKGNFAFYKGILFLLPSLIGLRLKILNNQKVKIKFLTHFFKNTDFEEFNTLAQNFAANKVPQNLNKKTIAFFLEHIKSNHTVCVVSASCPNWIQPWCNQYGVKFIGTELETSNLKITGNLATENCFGIEKVNRIKAIFNLDEFDIIKVYGGGKGDLEMLKLSKS